MTSTMGNTRPTFEVLDDSEDVAQNDLTKHGNADDRRDMARMGKIQQMQVSFTVTTF